MKKRIVAMVMCGILGMSAPVMAQSQTTQKEELTQESIMKRLYECAGFEFELSDRWQAAVKPFDEDTVVAGLFVSDDFESFLYIYAGSHKSDTTGTFDNMIGFFNKAERDKYTVFNEDDYSTPDTTGTVYMYLDNEDQVCVDMSWNFQYSVVEFVLKYPQNYMVDTEKTKIVTDDMSDIYTEMILATAK